MKNFFEMNTSQQVEEIMRTISNAKTHRTPLVVASEVKEEDPFIDLFWKQKEVSENSNPIPIPENTQFKFLKKIIGKLIRTYTRKQVHFNISTTSFLELTLKHFRQINNNQKVITQKLTEDYSRLIQNSLENVTMKLEAKFETRLKNLENSLFEYYESKVNNLKQEIEIELNLISKELSEVKKSKNTADLSDWISALERNHNNMNNWIELIDDRLKGVEGYQERTRKEIFAELKNSSNLNLTSINTSNKIEPEIINKEKVAKILSEGEIKVNLGSGSLVKSDYINVDMRPLEGVDIVSDVRDVPLKQMSVDELYLAHVIEHFSEIDMEKFILPYWYSLIKSGGKIRIVCPNWEAMLSGYSQGTISFEVLKEITFGSQEYEGNQHYNMFSPKSLIEMMSKIGFKQINIVSEARQNGLCLEMEIEGVR